jgi:hypothetical protein
MLGISSPRVVDQYAGITIAGSGRLAGVDLSGAY